MKALEISAKVGKDGKGPSTTVKLSLGESVAELLKQYGEEVVFNHAKSSLVVAAQGFLRSKMTGKNPVTDQKKLQEEMNGWKPGVRQPGKPQAEKAKEVFGKLSPEERKALLKELASQK